MMEELEALAETVEEFYAQATRFRAVVEQYEEGNLPEERVGDAFRDAHEQLERADQKIGLLVEGYAAGMLDAKMRGPGEERPANRSVAAMAESIDTTYCKAVDVYYDARHGYTGTLPR